MAVKIYSFQPNIWKSPSSNVFLEYNFPEDTEATKILDNFTICYWNKLTSQSAEGSVIMSIRANFQFYIGMF